MRTKTRSSETPRVLLVDDDNDLLQGLQRTLKSHGITADCLSDSSHALTQLASGNYAAVCLDWVMPGRSGAELLPDIISHYPEIPVIILTGLHDLANVVTCIKQGAYDYITKPVDAPRLVSIINKAFTAFDLVGQNRKLSSYLQGEPLNDPTLFTELITCNDRMLGICKIVESIRSSRQPVLITGETGVGKELIARAIHASSGLKGPMVTLNAAMLDEQMLSDTLFGHKRGAYTGAQDNREGLIEKARGGTIFLDEIGDLSHSSQLLLLRLIQQSEYYRLGSDVLRKSEARVITATNRDLARLQDSGSFRQDLFYRISTHHLAIPPLRERPEDVLPLVSHYLERSAKELQHATPKLSREASKILQRYNYPGNVRELINIIHNAVATNRTGTLEAADFKEIDMDGPPKGRILNRLNGEQYRFQGVFTGFPTLEDMEQLLVEEAMIAAKGHRGDAALLLGISRPTLRTILRKLQDVCWPEEKE